MNNPIRLMPLRIGICTALLSAFAAHASALSGSLPTPPAGVIASTRSATDGALAAYYDIRTVSGYAGNERFRRYDIITNIAQDISPDPAVKSIRHRLLVNCELMEFAEVEIRLYSDYFGEGLVGKKQVYNRWEEIAPGTQAIQIAQRACAIPVKELAPELPE